MLDSDSDIEIDLYDNYPEIDQQTKQQRQTNLHLTKENFDLIWSESFNEYEYDMESLLQIYQDACVHANLRLLLEMKENRDMKIKYKELKRKYNDVVRTISQIQRENNHEIPSEMKYNETEQEDNYCIKIPSPIYIL